MNESLPYVEAAHRMYGGEFGQGEGPGENLPAWLIFDQQYRNRYLFAGLPPRSPLPRRWFDSGVLTRASTLPELAEKIGIPAQSLAATVTRVTTPTPISVRYKRARTTPPSSSRATSAPRADWSPTRPPESYARTARSSRASTRQATPAPRSWATPTPAPAPPSAPPSSSATSPPCRPRDSP